VDHSNFKIIFFRGIINSFIFSFIWGAWAYYINRVNGDVGAINAAITQVSFTVINAFCYSVFMEYMFSLSQRFSYRILNAWVIPNLLVTVLLISIHYIRETTELMATVSGPLAIIYLVSAYYIYKEQRKESATLL